MRPPFLAISTCVSLFKTFFKSMESLILVILLYITVYKLLIAILFQTRTNFEPMRPLSSWSISLQYVQYNNFDKHVLNKTSKFKKFQPQSSRFPNLKKVQSSNPKALDFQI